MAADRQRSSGKSVVIRLGKNEKSLIGLVDMMAVPDTLTGSRNHQLIDR